MSEHPYKKYSEESVSHSRAKQFLKGYAGGGSVKHSDAVQDKKLIRSEFKKMERAEGDGDKFKRGGAVKDPKIVININKEAPGEARPPLPLPPLGPPAPPMMGVPPVPPGGAGPPPGMKTGGAVKMTAGAESGVGRLQKVAIQKRKK